MKARDNDGGKASDQDEEGSTKHTAHKSGENDNRHANAANKNRTGEPCDIVPAQSSL